MLGKFKFWIRLFLLKTVRRQLVLAFGLLSMLLMLSFVALVFGHQRGFLNQLGEERASSLAEAMSSSSTPWVLANDLAGLQEVLRGFANVPDMHRAFVLSPHGEVLASTRSEEVGRYVSDPISLGLLKGPAVKMRLVDQQDRVDVAVPILAGERLVGWARVELNRQQANVNLRQVLLAGFGFALLALVLTALTSYLLARRLTDGLYHFMQVAREIGQGRRDVRADVVRNDEMGQLARALNQMLDTLTASEAKLERLKRFYEAWTGVSEAIVREKEEPLLLARICNILAHHLPAQQVWIALRTEEGQLDVAACSSSHAESYTHLDELDGPVAAALRDAGARIYNDFPAQLHLHPWMAKLTQEGCRALAVIPLSRGGKLAGAFCLHSAEPGFFNHELVAMMHGLAEDVSFALDNLDHERRRREAEAKLAQAAKVFESTTEGIMITDQYNRIISVNWAFEVITGYTEDEVLGKDPGLLGSGRHDEEFYRKMWASIKKKGVWQGEIWNRRHNGEVYPEWLNVSVVRDAAGNLTNYVGIFNDISERKVAEDRMRHLAHHDVLTDLPNRVLMLDRLEQALVHAQRSRHKVALLFLDIDHFKNINDTLGHDIGDLLLQEVARRLLDCGREQDTVSRQGGDEFVVILPETDAKGASLVAQKMLEEVSRPMRLLEHELRVTPSIGISIYPDDAKTIDGLIKQADTAMYAAKQAGRGNFKYCGEAGTEAPAAQS